MTNIKPRDVTEATFSLELATYSNTSGLGVHIAWKGETTYLRFNSRGVQAGIIMTNKEFAEMIDWLAQIEPNKKDDRHTYIGRWWIAVNYSYHEDGKTIATPPNLHIHSDTAAWFIPLSKFRPIIKWYNTPHAH